MNLRIWDFEDICYNPEEEEDSRNEIVMQMVGAVIFKSLHLICVNINVPFASKISMLLMHSIKDGKLHHSKEDAEKDHCEVNCEIRLMFALTEIKNASAFALKMCNLYHYRLHSL